MTEEEALNTEGLIYRHFKGGIYKYVGEAKSSDDPNKRVVVYQHLWPHAFQLWIRNSNEFFSYVNGVRRFTLVSINVNGKISRVALKESEGFLNSLTEEQIDSINNFEGSETIGKI